MTDYLYLDIETIPTTNPDHIAEIAKGVTPPANMSKPETIAKWDAEQKPEAVKEAVARTSFNGAYGSICSIAWAWNDDKPSSVHAREIGEQEHLSWFVRKVVADRPNNGDWRSVQIVGHYVADFDLRFMWQRAMVLGVRMPTFWPRDLKPWSKDIFDTMNVWAGAKGSISLDKLCAALGIPGKDGVDGSMVAQMWADGRYDEVAAYNRDDVERVRNVHRKMMIAYGEI